MKPFLLLLGKEPESIPNDIELSALSALEINYRIHLCCEDIVDIRETN